MTRTREELLAELIAMHCYRRPMGSSTEAAFIDAYIAPLPGAWQDQYGNWHVPVGESKILWSCHTDTVHRTPGYQKVRYGTDGVLELAKSEKPQYRKEKFVAKNGNICWSSVRVGGGNSNCLGADDTAGVFLMRNMILRGVPGYYIFHYGEERGGQGSSELANHPKFLEGFDFAIALDRRGFGDIITEQAFAYCASNVFADSLALQLDEHGLRYEGSDWGIFTDTALYTESIPECTNLSVGYQNEHTEDETLDCGHVLRLLDALTALRQEELVVGRTPGEDKRPNPYQDDDDEDVIEQMSDEAYAEWLERFEASCPRSNYLDPIYEEVQRHLRDEED